MERLKTKVSSHINDYKDILDEILKADDCKVPRDDDEVVCGKVKHELRVQIHQLRVQIHELRVPIHELRVQVHELRVSIHKLEG